MFDEKEGTYFIHSLFLSIFVTRDMGGTIKHFLVKNNLKVIVFV